MTATAVKALLKAAILGTIGAGLVGISTITRPAIALTTEQVSEKLAQVPVYVIGSEQGLVLISANREGEPTEPSLFVFMNEEDANNFLTRANENNPEFAPNAEVTLTSLENLYKESVAGDNGTLRLTYFPEAEEVSQASAINTEYRGGVPLFLCPVRRRFLSACAARRRRYLSAVFLKRRFTSSARQSSRNRS